MKRLQTVLCIALLTAVGCAKGIDPPAASKVVFVTGGDLIFHFGDDRICADKTEKTSCDPELITFPKVRLKLDPFAIDEHEVTNLQFLHCVEKGPCNEPEFGNAQGIDKYYDDDPDHSFKAHPVVNVTWLQAQDYCTFVGKRLPTEFEWELVAKLAGKNSADTSVPPEIVHPWGTAALSGCEGKDVAIKSCNATFGLPQQVMAMADDVVTVKGEPVYDLAGNVSEWVADVYDADITCRADACSEALECGHEDSDAQCIPCTDCTSGKEDCHAQCVSDTPQYVCLSYPDKANSPDKINERRAKGGDRVLRGANYLSGDLCEARVSDRDPNRKKLASTDSKNYLGFRCACDADKCP